MKNFILFMDSEKSSLFGFRRRTVTKMIRVESFSLHTASVIALQTYGGSISAWTEV